MPQTMLGELLRCLPRPWALQQGCDRTDGELVKRFVAARDELMARGGAYAEL